MDMKVYFKEDGDILRGFVEGEIDAYTAPQLREGLDAAEVTEGTQIEVDLTHVNYIDSTGLGVFVAFYKRVQREGGDVRLVGLSERIQRLFEITGLSELMNIQGEKKVELS
ncbi:anti-sigma B factor antagonist [Lysinibacillus sp. BF-4]|uniref:Anti-sigma factor antagonist n=1 Tax=Metalysinibacillus saudimassiliensis TaxID=1461583 RepID=A0A078M8S9_9BACL|nr:STAS domain-containing protein [Lysinibacillus sp. BF-4]KFL42757.1 anti-sigma B factor antagonist [Lysinibacillus sp. BF-4]CEA03843.1 Anti-sigma-B factor antagonist [Metalysinibacillus saudimassiliensis]